MSDVQNRVQWNLFLAKILVGVFPALLFRTIWGGHPALGFGVGACIGIVAQSFLPPRGTMRSVGMLLLYGLAVSVLYGVFERLR
jgi:hypothetical protein